MNRSKILDQKWHKKVRKINKILLPMDKDPNPEIVVDHVNRTLRIHSINKSSKRKKGRFINLKIKKKAKNIENLHLKIEKNEKNTLIKNYYLNLLNDLKLNLYLYTAKTNSSYTISEKNKKVSEIYASLYPIPHISYRETFINEFIEFIEFLKKDNLFDINSLDFIDQVTSASFYNIKRKKTNSDFRDVTKSYLAFIERYDEVNQETFNARKIKKVFKSFLHKIEIDKDIKVKIKNKYLFSVDSGNVYIPSKTNHRKPRIVKLLSHEILVHAYRAILGKRNRNTQGDKLLLLQSGNSNNTQIEEGLGSFFEQNTFYESNKYDIYQLFNFYLRTITVHLAMEEDPYTVYEKLDKLCSIYAKVYGLSEKGKNGTRDVLILRIFRGFTHPERGCINARIAQYLVGNRMIWEFIEQGGNVFNLFAGKIQINQIEEYKKLGFHIPEDFLGYKEFPREYIFKLVDECFSELNHVNN